MKTELEKKLSDKYPKIFADTSKPATESLMCFGCCCGNGWYELIEALCHVLQSMTDEDPKESPQVVAFQIKEKFGTLRFYCNAVSDKQNAIINFAQHMSSHCCEICGMSGAKLRQGGWVRTLCDSCEEKRKLGKVLTDIQKNIQDDDS